VPPKIHNPVTLAERPGLTAKVVIEHLTILLSYYVATRSPEDRKGAG